jgi:hypothetical protein
MNGDWKMIFSLIDIGSNTVKLAVYDTPSLRPVYFISKQIGLADYVMIQDDHTCIMTEEGKLYDQFVKPGISSSEGFLHRSLQKLRKRICFAIYGGICLRG